MQVLSKGTVLDWSVETLCTGFGYSGDGCGAKLLVERSDLYKTHAPSLGDDHGSEFVSFVCPVCGVETQVESRTVPAAVLRAVRAKATR